MIGAVLFGHRGKILNLLLQEYFLAPNLDWQVVLTPKLSTTPNELHESNLYVEVFGSEFGSMSETVFSDWSCGGARCGPISPGVSSA